ncbi:hypothetical protein [Pseudogracilibacillus sp. SO10305]|uniref:hypothetical protein n=1 Tax=Pseudogracilibacillus sp. SO10305 TaxID=3098292 RepID=UPI00300E6B3F
MFNIFDELSENLHQEEIIEALVTVSIIEEFDGENLSFTIDKVLSGSNHVEGDLFLVERSVLEDEDAVHQAKLKIGYYENLSFPNIECVSIRPVS